MEAKQVGAFVVGGFVVGAIVVAFFLILGSKPMPAIPWYKECTEDGQCRDELECADCMRCQTALKRCVYGMKGEKDCNCVEKEKMACEQSDGNPGEKICMRKGPLHTEWGECGKIEEK